MTTKLTLRKAIKAFIPYGILLLYEKIYLRIIRFNISTPKQKSIFNKNYKWPIVIRKRTSDRIVYNDIIVQRKYEFETERIPNVIIDAGANIGLASIYFANKYPNAVIVALEPEKSNYEILVKNTKNYSNIITLQVALFNKVGKIDLIDPGFGKWGFMTEEDTQYYQIKANGIKKLNTVDSITINKIMEDYRFSEIDILKMDIEAAEKEVFRNASEWINRVNSIIVELHEERKTGCKRSFYCNTDGFDNEWEKGEEIYLTRGNYIKNNMK